jgi:hypothetical protein
LELFHEVNVDLVSGAICLKLMARRRGLPLISWCPAGILFLRFADASDLLEVDGEAASDLLGVDGEVCL